MKINHCLLLERARELDKQVQEGLPNSMSTEGGEGFTGKKAAKSTTKHTETTPGSQGEEASSVPPATPAKLAEEQTGAAPEGEKKPAAAAATKRDQSSESTSPTTPEKPEEKPRQVIAVSASKGPAAFFNLARKFLVTDEMCDLSALEGAIVSAVDAAHLLERSKLATIVR